MKGRLGPLLVQVRCRYRNRKARNP